MGLMTKATFLKYPSIENHFHTSDLQKWVDRYPEVQYLPWEVTEKIDGANVQLLFLGDGTYMIGRREAWLTPGEKFFDIWNTLAREPKLVDILTTYAGSNNKPIRVYCELFSDSINKRVRYGKTQSLRILDISLENDGQEQFLNKIQLKAFLGRLDLREFYVPVVGIYSSFKEALEVSEFFDSLILKEKNNPAEGLVMCPMKIPEFPGVYPTPENQLRFMIKKKSAAFLETKPNKIKTIV
jgi:hypothetical protein